jgi:hypothetical protein
MFKCDLNYGSFSQSWMVAASFFAVMLSVLLRVHATLFLVLFSIKVLSEIVFALQYKFAPDLIVLDAYETVESWMTTKNLNPRKLIPAMMRYSSEPHAK